MTVPPPPSLTGKTLLMPNMTPTGSPLLVAALRAFGVNAVVMPTMNGLALGKELTSGKECFPCQVTLGDVLHYLSQEKTRLKEAFAAKDYVYFMPEAGGPCRFGMYNTLHRIVLDRFPEFRETSIVTLSTDDGYDSSAIFPRGSAGPFRKLAFTAMILADVLDRIACRTRPYETVPGAVDACISAALDDMGREIEASGASLDFSPLDRLAAETAKKAARLIDRTLPRRPRVGIVGEIYVRSHPGSNQELIRTLETLGAEVVNASLTEWFNFVTHLNRRDAAQSFQACFKDLNVPGLAAAARFRLVSRLTMQWQLKRQNAVYARVRPHLDIAADHDVAHLETYLDSERLYSFAIGTEAGISIAGALAYAHDAFDGVVNVFPFTCMPSTICSAILKPMLLKQNIPYLDSPHDGSNQPNRDITLRTFMHQVARRAELRMMGGSKG
ncbi:CoA activase [Desulfovibrio sulfodismutans]|uniref:CoA activase n=1 Tax=Desulfolutivibrio sulfodismutans TaxID=63561 RepID=A0A7K3NMA4_9BACT|nr:CoA activase [Desulfolutivibrio sulfodismutans]NDY56963.1 CoA activase [Desulfolutivibrio sulfodismutans]QLA11349.1 CoA activase [Desulfolutivibrio sulfodismutans DSM 3696]